MHRSRRGGPICVAGVLIAWLCSCGQNAPPTPEIDLTIDVDSSVVNAALASITSLSLHATGDETYDHVVPLSRPLSRDERMVYEASSSTRTVGLEMDAFDATGTIVASGSVAPVTLMAKQRVAETLTLRAPSVSADLGTNDGASDLARLTYAQTVLADAPVVYYRFDETGGTVAADSSGNAVTAEYQGTIAFSQPGALANDPSTAIAFQEDTTAVVRTNAETPVSFAGNSPYSIEIWMNPPVIDDNYHLLFNWDDYPTQNTRQHYGMFVQESSGTVLERVILGQSEECNAPLPEVGKWTHFVGTYDGATLRLYMNGVLACSVDDARPFTTDIEPLYIANGGPGWTAVLATFDEAAVYPTALSAARVLAHYQAAQ